MTTGAILQEVGTQGWRMDTNCASRKNGERAPRNSRVLLDLQIRRYRRGEAQSEKWDIWKASILRDGTLDRCECEDNWFEDY